MNRLTLVSALAASSILSCSRRETTSQPMAQPSSSPPQAPSAAPASPAVPRSDDMFDTSKGPLTLRPLHHASLLLQIGGKTLCIDPTEDAIALSPPPADYVILTHTHGDHFVPSAIAKVRKPGTIVIGPREVTGSVEGVVVMNNGDKRSYPDFEIEAVAAYNQQRGPAPGKLFHDKGRGNGYVLTIGGKRIYVSGDTECIPEMKSLTGIDVAFLCMNLPYTMPPSEAAECVKSFRPKVVYPYHHRGSSPEEFASAVGPGIEVRIRKWY